MPKYYDNLETETSISQASGSNLNTPVEFLSQSSTLISLCTFCQNILQQVIYTSYGEKLLEAKKTLKDFPSPKSRYDFICAFQFENADEVAVKIFDFSRSIFSDIYELRNILAHEVWSSSSDCADGVYFASLDENSRLAMASGRLWHDESVTPKNIYEATTRYIRKIKVVKSHHLSLAIADANLCSWSLMNLHNLLNAENETQRAKARSAFLRYRGTSHLFEDPVELPDTIEFTAVKKKKIEDGDIS